MSARADFQVFTFNEHLGDNESEINTGFTFMGEFSSTKIFEINQELFNSSGSRRIKFRRGRAIHETRSTGSPPAVDIDRTGHGETGLETHNRTSIPASFLKRGRNRHSLSTKGRRQFSDSPRHCPLKGAGSIMKLA